MLKLMAFIIETFITTVVLVLLFVAFFPHGKVQCYGDLCIEWKIEEFLAGTSTER